MECKLNLLSMKKSQICLKALDKVFLILETFLCCKSKHESWACKYKSKSIACPISCTYTKKSRVPKIDPFETPQEISATYA